MPTTIMGSSRHDENGKYIGGKNGDQKQTAIDDYTGEVSMQTLASFVGSRKWYVLRPKKIEHAEALAKAMKIACNNKHIGYDQDKDRYGIVSHGVDTSIDVGSDCSSNVRACIIKAMGVDLGDFTTANEKSKLENSGLFFKAVLYTSTMVIYDGDVFVTQKKGHTGICVYGKSRRKGLIAQPTLKKGSKGEEVALLQQHLNRLAGKEILEEDGIFGRLTDKVLRNWQETYELEIDGIYGPISYETMCGLFK